MHVTSNNNWFKLLLIAITITIVSLSSSAYAKGDVFVNSKGEAIRGFDPVAYFVNAKARKGKKAFSHVHAGNTWLFTSDANKRAFIANPAKYTPQYGGHCALAASSGSIVATDPYSWTVRGGKLYLNYDKFARASWLGNAASNIKSADAKWPALAKQVSTR